MLYDLVKNALEIENRAEDSVFVCVRERKNANMHEGFE